MLKPECQFIWAAQLLVGQIIHQSYVKMSVDPLKDNLHESADKRKFIV